MGDHNTQSQSTMEGGFQPMEQAGEMEAGEYPMEAGEYPMEAGEMEVGVQTIEDEFPPFQCEWVGDQQPDVDDIANLECNDDEEPDEVDEEPVESQFQQSPEISCLGIPPPSHFVKSVAPSQTHTERIGEYLLNERLTQQKFNTEFYEDNATDLFKYNSTFRGFKNSLSKIGKYL